MANDSDGPLSSLIAQVLDAEQHGQPIDREALIDAHPDHAAELREFFAGHDRFKSEGEAGQSELASDDPGQEDDATLPPSQTPAGDDATLPPTPAAKRVPDDGQTLPPTESNGEATSPGIGERVRYFGDYELVEEIARGGMGVVFKARQLNLNRTVALKMILAGQFAGEEDVQRFHIEAEAAAQLDHPGIVPIFEIGEHSGQHYFSMGFVEGQSLAAKVVEGPLAPLDATRIVQKVCESMAYAHERGVIHRDLKPANILIDPNGFPKVTDFGLAKKTEADSAVTGTGQILGTPAYMPPEQAAGGTDDVGPLADVYSLGAVLYCLLTGRPPFQAATPFDTLMQVLDKEPAPPMQLNPAIGQDLQTVTLKCLEKEPSKRYQSAGELAEELDRILNGEPIHARPISTVEKTYRWCRRHPSLSGLLVALAASILAIMVGGYFSAYQMNQLRQSADEKRVEAEGLAEKNRQLADRNRSIAEQESEQRKAAETQRKIAQQEKAEAERLAEANRKQLVSTRLMTADSLIVDRGDPGAALPYYLSAMKLDEAHPKEIVRHRRRINAALGSIPKFTQLWRHDSNVNHIALSSDESRVATSSHDQTVQVRDLETGEPTLPPLKHDHPVWCSAFSGDGKVLVTASGTAVFGFLRFWDLETGDPIGEPINTGMNPFFVTWTGGDNVCAAAISMQGSGRLIVYDRESRTEQHSIPFTAVLSPQLIQQTIHAPTSRFVRVRKNNFYQPTIEVFDLDRPNRVIARLEHPDSVSYASFSSDGSRLVTATWHQIFVWDIATGEQIMATEPDQLRSASVYPDPAMKCAFTFDNRKVTATTSGNWSVVINEEGKLQDLKELSQFSRTDKYPDPSGRLTAYVEQDGVAHLWDSIGERFFTAPMRHSASVLDLRFTRDGRKIITASADGMVRIWDLASVIIQREKRLTHRRSPVQFAQLSSDGSEITTGTTGWVQVRNFQSGEQIHDKWWGGGMLSVSASSDSDLIAFGGNNHSAIVVNRRTGERAHEFKHELRAVRSVDLDSDGTLLATISSANNDGPEQFFGRVNLFDLAKNEKLVGPLDFSTKKAPSFLTRLTGIATPSETQGVVCVSISPDNRQVAYGGALMQLNGELQPRLRVRDLETGEENELKCGDGKSWLMTQSIEYSASGQFLIGKCQNPMTGTGAEVRVWKKGSLEQVFGPIRLRGRCGAVEISPDESTLAIAEDRVVYVYDLASGNPVCRPLRHPSIVNSAEFSPNLELATACDDLAVRLWDVYDGRLLAPPIKTIHPIEDLEVLDDGRLMICNSSYVDIWRLKPTKLSRDELVTRTRLMTGIAGLDDGGESIQATSDDIHADWDAVQASEVGALAVTEEQVSDWYSRMLDRFGSQRDWSTMTFHRSHMIERKPDDINLLYRQAGTFGENRQYDKAAPLLNRVSSLNPGNLYVLFERAHAELRAGNQTAYQNACDEMVERFLETEIPHHANQIGKTLLLGKAKCDDEELPFRLIKQAYDAAPENAWFIVDQANAEKEKGNFEASIELCDNFLRSGETNVLRPTALAIRSIAKWKLDNEKAATEDLAAAKQARQQVVRQYSGIWLNLAVCDQLLKEAESLAE